MALYRDWRSVELPQQERAMLTYAEKLTSMPWSVTEDDLAELRAVGFSDENIVDIVLVTAYRNFINRVHLALGLSPDFLRQRMGPELVEAIVKETAAKQGR